MKFRTQINPIEFPFKLNFEDPIVLWGSCFTNNIGEILCNHYLDVSYNPFGIVFNPYSIKNQIFSCLKEELQEDLIFQKGENFYSFQFGTKYFATSKQAFLNKTLKSCREIKAKLLSAQCLVITLGTSWVYDAIKLQQTVASCHKIPQKEFSKKLHSVSEIQYELLELLNELNKFNPNLKFIFTISPVRHIKDGIVENSLSKARLIEAVHSITNTVENAFYFPAYEIFMDDLRDYRFYGEDLVHPSKQGINYVWEIFKNSLFEVKDFQMLNILRSYHTAVNHQPMINNLFEEKKHKEFISKTKRELLSQAPFLENRL